MQTRRQARRKAWQAAAVTEYSQRDWEIGQLLFESQAFLHTTSDRLNNVVTCGRDIAVLSCVNRTFCKVAQQLLWPQLVNKFEADKQWAALRYSRRYHQCSVQALCSGWTQVALGNPYDFYKEMKTKPASTPDSLFRQLLTSSKWGAAEKQAKKVFRLTEKELQELPCTEHETPKRGLQRRYSLVSLAVAARSKYGTEAAMQAAAAAKADKIKAGRDAAAERRCQALAQDLLKLGTRLASQLRRLWLVKGYIKGGCKEQGAVQGADEALVLARLAAWALKHTGFKLACRILLHSDGRSLDLWKKWKEAYNKSGGSWFCYPECIRDNSPLVHRLSAQEERECLDLAVQHWAAERGRKVAALRRRSVPSKGVLRDAISSALSAQVDPRIAELVPAAEAASGRAAAAEQSEEELTDNDLRGTAGQQEADLSDSSDDYSDDIGW